MLTQFKTITSFSVSSIPSAREFYVDKLGLEVIHEDDYMIRFKTGGDTGFMIYMKEEHKPADYTVLNFEVDDVRKTVMELKEKGIMMEQYPDLKTDADGISKSEEGEIAWFKDPSGNILSLMKY